MNELASLTTHEARSLTDALSAKVARAREEARKPGFKNQLKISFGRRVETGLTSRFDFNQSVAGGATRRSTMTWQVQLTAQE